MRREFSAKTKVAAYERCGGRCEGCGAVLHVGRFAYDHQIPDGLGGEPTLENCMVLCTGCHGAKTAGADVPRIAKMKRQKAKHLGAKQSRKPLPGGRNSPLRKKLNGQVVPRE